MEGGWLRYLFLGERDTEMVGGLLDGHDEELGQLSSDLLKISAADLRYATTIHLCSGFRHRAHFDLIPAAKFHASSTAPR